MLFVNVISQPPWRGSRRLSVTVTSHITRSEISGQTKISVFNLTTTGIVSFGTAAGEEPGQKIDVLSHCRIKHSPLKDLIWSLMAWILWWLSRFNLMAGYIVEIDSMYPPWD
jgi:hypothetical protein